MTKSNTLASVAFVDSKGKQPAADYVGKERREYIEGPMTEEYGRFLQAMIASDVVDNVRGMAEESELVVGKISDRPFFVTDEDLGMSGATGKAYAIVNPGKKNGKLRITTAHTDSPCLMLPRQPLWFDVDALTQNVCPSFSLLTVPYGSIRASDWYGRDVVMIGYVYRTGKGKRRITVNGVIKQMSLHVETEDDERNYAGLKVDTGLRTKEDVYRAFGITNDWDFQEAEIYVVPNRAENQHVVGNDLTAYGHDDRSCVWASTRAALDAIRNGCGNTIIAFGLDKEEVGAKGSSAGFRGFSEAVIKETLERVLGTEEYKRLDLPLDLAKSRLMGGMPALILDVEIGLGPLEVLKIGAGDSIDVFNAAKCGWGLSISAKYPQWDDYVASPEHIGMFKAMLNKAFGRRANQRYQVVGSCNTPDVPSVHSTMADVFYKYVSCLVAGVPVVGLHGIECLNRYDLYWLTEAVKLYYGVNPRNRRRRRR